MPIYTTQGSQNQRRRRKRRGENPHQLVVCVRAVCHVLGGTELMTAACALDQRANEGDEDLMASKATENTERTGLKRKVVWVLFFL